MIRTGFPINRYAQKDIDGTTLVDCRIKIGTGFGTDVLASGDATSDQRTEGDSVAGWTGSDAALSSVSSHGGISGPFAGSKFMRILGNAGDATTVGEARKSGTTVIGTKYRVRVVTNQLAANTDSDPVIKIGTTAGGAEIASIPIPDFGGDDDWSVIEFDFVATATTTHITIYGALDTESLYADDVSIRPYNQGKVKYLYPQAFIVVTEWSDGSDFLKITPPNGGPEVSFDNSASKAFQADRQYDVPLALFRSSGANETGFSIICLY